MRKDISNLFIATYVIICSASKALHECLYVQQQNTTTTNFTVNLMHTMAICTTAAAAAKAEEEKDMVMKLMNL